MTFKKIALSVSLALLAGLSLEAQERPLWMRYPSISPDGTQIAFSYQGDIYRVSTRGGQAVRLTTHPAYDNRPIWSPDGKLIAFTSERNGLGHNIFVMNASGGEARQLTTHSATETPYSFTPDGKHVIFKAAIQDDYRSTLFPSGSRSELYQVPIEGGRIERILGIPAEYAVMSRDGKRLLFQDYKGAENEWRKHHTSSITRDILEYDIARGTFRYIVQRPGEDRNPLYTPDGQGIYFLSEPKGGTFNVYRSDLSGGGMKALTNFSGDPVRFLSMDKAGKLCFGYAGEIYTLVEGQAPQRVAISITSDRDNEEKDRMALRSGASSVVVSPDGKQIAFAVRGEVFVTSAEHTTTKRITHTPAVERGISFGKDGRSLIYSSARDGHWDLYRTRMTRSEDPNMSNATMLQEEKLIPEIKGEKDFAQLSPDGKELAFVHERERLVVYNLESKTLRRIMPDGLLQNGVGALDYKWSPDGKWFVVSYVARAHAPYNDIGLVRADGSGEVINLTNSGYASGNPRWALDGNAIIFGTDRYGMRNHASWGSMEDVMMIFLNRAAYERYRMTEEERELSDEAKKKADKASEDAKDKKDTPASKTILVELEGLEDRVVRLTPNSSNLADAIVSPDGKKLYYYTAFEGDYDLWALDMDKRTTKLVNKSNTGAPRFVQDPSGKYIYIFGSMAQRLDPKSDALKAVSYSAEMKLDREQERLAMYEEVVREEGLRFYRADMHGVDWARLTKHYRRYLPYITTGHDFSEMLSELLGELNVSHTGSGYRSPLGSSSEPTAELGLFVSDRKGRDGLLVDEVVLGGPFDRSTSQMKAGATITAIDGTEIKAGEDYFPLLNGKVGKKVLVSYRTPEGKQVDEVIKPISSGALSSLLYRRWVRQRADMVERLSGGKLGYVHIPSMGDPSFRTAYSEALGRYYGRKGIVIDIRHNGGGRLHEDIEVLFSGKQYLMQ